MAFQADFTRPAYEAAIGRVIDYIHAGDAFQVNLAQRFTATLSPDDTPWALYRRLRQLLRPEHGAFLQLGDLAICSASPERLVRLQGDLAEARPIKGTRPRGRDPEEDAALARELLESEKDRAENTMIVDLLRNDLSRVCRDGSIEVPTLCALMSLPSVHHLVSIIRGRLRPEAGPLDLIRAVFPGGSITGAPKVRAMEIIAELEPVRRGPYCGSLGYIGLDGNIDLSIAIRTITVEGGTVEGGAAGGGLASFHAGGGIVADSDPAAEYEETLAKARSLAEAIAGRPDPLSEPEP